MSPTQILFSWYLKRDRVTLAVLASVLFLFELLVIWLGRYLEETESYSQLLSLVPGFVRQAVGFDIKLLLSFAGVVALGYFHPLVMAILMTATVTVARSPVLEVDTRCSELLLARPVSRRSLVAATLCTLVAVATLLPSAMLAGTLTGLTLVGRIQSVSLALYLNFALQAALLMLAFGALFVLMAVLSTRVRAYLQIAVGLCLASYLVDTLGRIWSPLQPLRPLSLFHWSDPGRLLMQQTSWPALLVLACVALVAGVAALIVVEQSDF